MNSYLKVLFENDDTLDRLHSIAANLQNEIPKLSIRSLPSLHMTLFFGGEILCNELSKDELHYWHTQVQNCFAASHFCSPSSSAAQEIMPPDFWFHFARLRTFPPHRNNLIVAEFEASPAWHALYRDLQTIARDSPGFQELATTQPWIPHITLANLPRSTESTLNRLLEAASNEFPKNETIVASGIGMGGPVPLQDELNWNFVYGGSGSSSIP
jgi:2'-5' RNA ligase